MRYIVYDARIAMTRTNETTVNGFVQIERNLYDRQGEGENRINKFRYKQPKEEKKKIMIYMKHLRAISFTIRFIGALQVCAGSEFLGVSRERKRALHQATVSQVHSVMEHFYRRPLCLLPWLSSSASQRS